MPDVLYEEVIEVEERVVLKQEGGRVAARELVKEVTGVIWCHMMPH